MNKQEAEITPKINKWFRRVAIGSCPFEIKHTRGNNEFEFDELSEHQRNYLVAATTEIGCLWKIPDANMGYNPFDCIFYKNSSAYVIIAFPVWTVVLNILDIDKHFLEQGARAINEDEALAYVFNPLYKILTKDL